MIKDNNIQLNEISLNENYSQINLIDSENDLIMLKQIFRKENIYRSCLINYDNNNDYLYINYNRIKKEDENKIDNNLLIINLNKKKIVQNLELPDTFNSIINWNNKAIIFQSYESFYIFDTKINKIISKYNLGKNDNKDNKIKSIKTFISKKNNFYSLFFQTKSIEYFIIY